MIGSMPVLRRRPSATVGRKVEQARLADRFAHAAEGRANVVLLIGDAGIGKTRLLEEAAGDAVHNGALVLRGRGSDIEGMPPYLLFREALVPYVRSAPSALLRRQLGPGAAALGELFPDLKRRHLSLRAAPLPPEEARLRLFEAVGQFLRAIAAERPLVLLLDDLHWADPASLDLLGHVVCRQNLGRVLVAGACREGEVGANAALARVADRLNRDRLLTLMQLSPLSTGDIAKLAADLLSGPVDDAAGSALYEHSEGNPFFAEELLQYWREGGDILLKGGYWRLSPDFAPNHLPAGIIGTVRQRLARLPAEISRCLDIASLIGRTFEPELVAAVADVPVDAVEGSLMTAQRSGLVRADQAGSFSFTHDKIRECLLATIPKSRRRRWHRAIGDAIEASHRPPDAEDIAALAFHFPRSDDRKKGAHYALVAAGDALGNYAAATAAAHYRTALQLIDPEDNRRADILLGLGKALTLADDLSQAKEAYQRAHAAALQQGERLIALRAALGLAEVNSGLRQCHASCTILQESIVLFPSQPRLEVVHALSQLAQAEATLGNTQGGFAHAREAQRLAADFGDPILEARACRALSKLLTRIRESAPEGAQLAERALTLAKTAGDTREAAACLFRIAYAALNAGDLKRTFEVSFARVELARQAHDPFQLCHARSWLAYMAALAGDWTTVARLAAELEASAKRLQNPEPLSFLWKAQGYTALQRGEFPAAEAAFGAVDDILGDRREGLTLYRGLLGLAQLAVGKFDTARASIVKSERLLAAMPCGSVAAGPILVCLAAMARRLEDRPLLHRCYQALLPFSGQYYWFLVDRVLAETELAFGDLPAAEQHLAAAEIRASQQEMRPEQALLPCARADFELARGGRGSAMRARDALKDASGRLESLGMTAEAKRAREHLRRLPPQPGALPRVSLPAGLSGREAQVLGLVAAGLSNRQIACELALSNHTVANHLTTIFNKTGANNRAAAAVFAVQHGLVEPRPIE
jgi:DNA-binding CsgD family transcriptional regulator/tetratricopeptide (TPR) repeat protein